MKSEIYKFQEINTSRAISFGSLNLATSNSNLSCRQIGNKTWTKVTLFSTYSVLNIDHENLTILVLTIERI